MNILKILIMLVIFVPGVVIAHSAELHNSSNKTSSVNTSTGNADVKNTGIEEKENTEQIDNKTLKEDVNLELNRIKSKLGDDNDGEDALDNNEARTRSDDDGLDELGIEVVENDSEDDSFYNVFKNDLNESDDMKDAVEAFMKIEDSSKGKSTTDLSKVKSQIKGRDLKEIVILGGEVREKAQKNKIEVRGWDSKNKKVTITPNDVKKGGDFINFIGAITLNDKNIKKVSFNQEEITIKYNQPAKLFGFIPMNLTAKVELSKENKVKVKFPWYTFLTRNNAKEIKNEIDALSFKWGVVVDKKDTELKDRAQKFQTISNVLRRRHDAMTAIIQNIK